MDGDDSNRPNINDIRALDTLTNFLRVPHETASDIVSMFSYLTVEDVTARMQRAGHDAHAQVAGTSHQQWNSTSRQKRRPLCPGGCPSAQKPPSPPPLPTLPLSEQRPTPGKVSLSEFLDPSMRNLGHPLPLPTDSSSEDTLQLEEEVLEELIIHPTPRAHPKMSSTKFGNFLEDDEEEGKGEEENENILCDDPFIGDILQDGGYQASFMKKEDFEMEDHQKSYYLASLNKNLSVHRPVSCDGLEGDLEEEVYEEAARLLACAESDTSIGTLAPQKTAEVSPSPRANRSKTLGKSGKSGKSNVRHFQNKNGNSHEEEKGAREAREKPESKRKLSWEKESEAPPSTDLEPPASESSGQRREKLEDEISTFIQQRMKREQREDPEDSEDSCSEDIGPNSKDNAGVYTASSRAFVQNPGEVVDQEEEGEAGAAADVRLRCLDFVAVKPAKTAPESVPSTEPDDQLSHTESQESSDEVVPFVLDEDFDYDNVVLTPKFSAEEMAYLKTFTSGGESGHI